MRREKLPDQAKIVFFKGIVNYTEIYLQSGRKEIFSYTLLRFQEQYGHFLRVSKNHLVNPSYIKELHDYGDCKEVELLSGKRLKVSRRRKEVLMNLK